jgi:hypothetical protein
MNEIIFTCCYVKGEESCGMPADFEILDLADECYETLLTQAREDYLGAMMGHHPSVGLNAEHRWEVAAMDDGRRVLPLPR